jgi:hypothetical protein
MQRKEPRCDEGLEGLLSSVHPGIFYECSECIYAKTHQIPCQEQY